MSNCNLCSVGEILKVVVLFCFVCFFVSFTHYWMTGLYLVLKGAMSQGCCCFWSIICLLPNLAKSKFWPNFQISFWESWKRNSILWKYRQRAFIWVAMHAEHRILSADSKVTFTLQNSIKHSGSERVKSQIFSWVRDITKISSKYHQAALPITIFWVIFAVIAIKKKLQKVGPTLS